MKKILLLLMAGTFLCPHLLCAETNKTWMIGTTSFTKTADNGVTLNDPSIGTVASNITAAFTNEGFIVTVRDTSKWRDPAFLKGFKDRMDKEPPSVQAAVGRMEKGLAKSILILDFSKGTLGGVFVHTRNAAEQLYEIDTWTTLASHADPASAQVALAVERIRKFLDQLTKKPASSKIDIDKPTDGQGPTIHLHF